MMALTMAFVGETVPKARTGYAMFQTANNTAVMTNLRQDQRGVISGLLNLGLITGTAVMGAMFAAASGATDVTTAAAAIRGPNPGLVGGSASCSTTEVGPRSPR
jgi:hypothetical protein